MLYLVLGCGPNSMGEAVAWGLLKEPDSFVFIADQNPENERQTYAKLKTLLHGEKSYISKLNDAGTGFDVIREQEKLARRFSYFDVVINALPAQLSLPIVEAVLKTNEEKQGRDLPKTHYCDLGGVLEITKKIIFGKIARRAERYGVSIIPDCGFQPGLGNILAMDALSIFCPKEPVESIVMYAGGLPSSYREPPLFYKKLFNLKGLEEIYYNWPLVLSKGKPRKIRPLSHYEKNIRHECVGLNHFNPGMEAAVTGGLGTLPYYLTSHVLTLQEKTLRWLGHYAVVKKVPREKFIEAFEIWLNQDQAAKNDVSMLKIVALGKAKSTGKRTKIEYFMCEKSDENWTSMQKATGFTTAVIAKLIASGEAATGAYPPEIALDPQTVIEALKKDSLIYWRKTPPC